MRRFSDACILWLMLVWFPWSAPAQTPTLSLFRVGSGSVELRWPTSAVDWRFAYTTDLNSGNWLGTTAQPDTVGNSYSISLPAGPTGFYQLRHRGAMVPFTTLEAEAPGNSVNGSVVTMTTPPLSTTSSPELEASGRAYVALSNTGDFVQFNNVPAANTLVVRHCIPDAPAGGGITATLSLYVNGTFRQSLSLSSVHNWLYGHDPAHGINGQNNDPSVGSPHVFWDEARFFIQGGVQAGDSLRLQKDAGDSAAFYRIDLIDLEPVAGPLAPPRAGTYLSVTDYGANGSDANDDTAAIQNCINAAKTAGKTVWIPAGTYYQSTAFTLDGVVVRGAGMWYTSIIGSAPTTGTSGFRPKGSGAGISDLYIDFPNNTYRSTNGYCIVPGGVCTHWFVENVWITHTTPGMWLSGSSGTATTSGLTYGTVRGCRVRSTYADGITLNSSASYNLVEQCHVRGCGDDHLAVNGEFDNGQGKTFAPSTGNTIRFSTAIAAWWGRNGSISGGSGHTFEDNYLADNALLQAFTIDLPNAYHMYPATDSIIRRNTIVRGGGNLAGQKRGAIWCGPAYTTISNVTFRDNEILAPIFRGIHFAGSLSQSLTFERNVIDSPGEDAIIMNSGTTGTAVFTDNVLRNLKTGFQAIKNNSSATFSVTQTGNSWQ